MNARTIVSLALGLLLVAQQGHASDGDADRAVDDRNADLARNEEDSDYPIVKDDDLRFIDDGITELPQTRRSSAIRRFSTRNDDIMRAIEDGGLIKVLQRMADDDILPARMDDSSALDRVDDSCLVMPKVRRSDPLRLSPRSAAVAAASRSAAAAAAARSAAAAARSAAAAAAARSAAASAAARSAAIALASRSAASSAGRSANLRNTDEPLMRLNRDGSTDDDITTLRDQIRRAAAAAAASG